MRDDVHPLSTELLAISQDPGHAAASTLDHVKDCVACRVRISRIQHDRGFTVPSNDSVQRIIDASTPLPAVLADLISTGSDADPQPNEIWRVGTTEALLVWVRNIFDDGIADVIPVVLDTDLADQHSLILDKALTPLSVEMAAIVPLRSHIPTRVFLHRIADVPIRQSIAEVMTAIREGRRPSGVHVGPPICDDRDQRVEYRQALRDLLAELSPSAASPMPEPDESEAASQSALNRSSREEPPDDSRAHAVKAELQQRLAGVSFPPFTAVTVRVNATVDAKAVLKVLYLDTTIVVVNLSLPRPIDCPDYSELAAAGQEIALIEADADALAIDLDSDALLFTSANLRPAVAIPHGNQIGPTPALKGLGLVDTLCKHLEGSASAWDVTDDSDDSEMRTDLTDIASRHAAYAMEQVELQGRRAHQAAKKSAWQSLDEDFGHRVAGFVASIVSDGDIDAALTRLGLEGE